MLLAAASATLAEVPPYSDFQLQARSNIVDGFNLPANSSFNSKTPALNDVGEIAFTLIVVGGGNSGLFVGSDGVGSVVYSAPAGRILSDPSINASGAVAFDQSDIFSDGIFVYDPVSMQTTLTVPATTFDFTAGATILDDERIGYRAGQFGGTRVWQLFESGAPTTYATEGGQIAYLFIPSTNSQPRFAGKVRLNNTGESAPDEIRTYSGPGTFTVVADDVDADASSPYTSFDNSVSQADDGRVAFIADLVGGGRGVFLTDGATTTTIATLDDPLVSGISFFRPAANSSGIVAFRGTDDQGLDAIFAGDGVELRRVIGEHDLVEIDLGTARIDQHDNSVVFGGSPAINERGDLGFNAALAPEDNDQIEWGSGMFIALASTAPPPVPDGKNAGSPMRVGKSVGSSDLVIRWDVRTCPADDYNLFFGDLAAVSSVTLSSAACGLGDGGLASVSPPPGSVFLILASQGTGGVESGHGMNSTGRPRPSNGIGFCGIVEQSLEGTCP
jgi:hypothetical protein